MSEAKDPTNEESKAAADPSASVVDGGTELEGEGQDRLVGIMYSEKRWIVQPWMKATFFWCAIALGAGLGAYIVDKRLTQWRLQMDSVVEPTPLNDIPAPGFVLPTGDGNKGLSLDSLKGQWVFINFWATWCPPCRDEMPSMEMLNRKFGGKNGKMKMLAISVDEDWNEVNRFFGDTKPSFEVLWDRRKTTARQWGTSKFPESFLVNPKGEVVAKFVGPRDWFNLGTVKYFEGVLNGKRDPT